MEGDGTTAGEVEGQSNPATQSVSRFAPVTPDWHATLPAVPLARPLPSHYTEGAIPIACLGGVFPPGSAGQPRSAEITPGLLLPPLARRETLSVPHGHYRAAAQLAMPLRLSTVAANAPQLTPQQFATVISTTPLVHGPQHFNCGALHPKSRYSSTHSHKYVRFFSTAVRPPAGQFSRLPRFVTQSLQSVTSFSNPHSPQPPIRRGISSAPKHNSLPNSFLIPPFNFR